MSRPARIRHRVRTVPTKDRGEEPARPVLASVHVTSCLAYPLENSRPPGSYVYPEATDL